MYTIFLGLLVSLFVGLGIAAFYTGPKAPEYPSVLEGPYAAPLTKEQATETAEQKTAREDYNKAQKEFQIQNSIYNRNVSAISLAAAIVIFIISLVLVNKILLISDGLLLGGVLTLLYSIIRGFASDSNMYRFILVTVGLIIAVILGYAKFIRHEKK